MQDHAYDAMGAGGFAPPSYDPEETIVTAAANNFNLELHAIVALHNLMGLHMGALQDEYITFPQTTWQVTSAEIQPFKALDDRYGENAIWGIFNFVDQLGGAFAFLEPHAASLVTGIPEEDLGTEEGMGYVESFLMHMGHLFMQCWQEIAQFDVETIPSPVAPSLGELQEMFQYLNPRTPIITTAFRVSQLGQAETARIVLAIPQPYLISVQPSLQALGENARAGTDTSFFHQRLAYLEDVSIPVSVRLGKAEMTVGDLQGLEEGDVIELDATVGLPLEVVVGSTHLMGKPGTSADGRRLAIQIVSQPS